MENNPCPRIKNCSLLLKSLKGSAYLLGRLTDCWRDRESGKMEGEGEGKGIRRGDTNCGKNLPWNVHIYCTNKSLLEPAILLCLHLSETDFQRIPKLCMWLQYFIKWIKAAETSFILNHGKQINMQKTKKKEEEGGKGVGGWGSFKERCKLCNYAHGFS